MRTTTIRAEMAPTDARTLTAVRRPVARRASDYLDLPDTAPTVAILLWSHVFDHFLESTGMTLDSFCEDSEGGWLTGYIEALRTAGIRTVVIIVLRSVDQVTYLIQKHDRAAIIALPAPRAFRAIESRMQDSYATSAALAFGETHGSRKLLRPFYGVAREVMPYISTPLRLLARELRAQRCAAMLCQEYEFPRFDVCALLSPFVGIPLFGVFQGADSQKWLLERVTRSFALRSCSGLIIGAQQEIDRVERTYTFPRRKIANIGNPIDTERWYPDDKAKAREVLGLPLEARVVVWHGRAALFHKGLDVLLDAWSLVSRELGPQRARLLMVGGGEDGPQVRDRIEAGGLEGVLFTDEYVHEIDARRTYLSAGDAYVLSSRFEGFPVALIEAMACGLPVVATDVNGVHDAVLAGSHPAAGIVVRREDASELADGITRLLRNPELCTQFGTASRQRAVERFGLEAVGKQLRDFVV